MKKSKWFGAREILLLGLLAGMQAAAQAPAFQVPYANTFEPDATLKVSLTFGADVGHLFVVDTGSVGIVVPKAELPRSITKAMDGSIRYTSSGLVVDGFWTEPIDVTIGSSGAIAHVPVFAATASHCLPQASNPCHEGSLPHMMGVGFGRPESYASPDRNPLLHIRNLPKGRTSNYHLTHGGIELGLADAMAIKGMKSMRLTPRTRLDLHNQPVTDYNTPSGLISMNGGRAQPVLILIDTGITNSLIALTSGEPAECLASPRKAGTDCRIEDGTRFSLSMVSGAVQSSFTLGDGAATTPDSAHWIHLSPREGSFINTGIHPLARFDLFYDGTSGTFGLNPARP